jgi:DNA-binding NarL/FixJ family response regulator
MASVGVLTVHHDEAARRATRAVVNSTPGFEAVGEAATAEEALELAVTLRPRLALVGTGMPGIDGFETSQRLLSAIPDAAVVLVYTTTEPDGDALARSQAAGALHLDELTPASLQALWGERQNR